MTRPVSIRVLNAEGVSERDPADEITRGILKPSAHDGPVDIWLLSEIAWADLAGIADKHDLHALHYGERGSAEAGVGILSRRPITAPRMRVGSRPVPGVRMRPLVTGRTYGLKVTAGHAPPPRTAAARALYLARVAATPGVIGLDSNMAATWMRRNFARTYRGVGVLGLLVPRRFIASHAVGVNVGSDHEAVDVRLERRKR